VVVEGGEVGEVEEGVVVGEVVAEVEGKCW